MAADSGAEPSSTLATLARTTIRAIFEYEGGLLTRNSLGKWAAAAWKDTPTGVLDSEPFGELLEYALSRCLDDDWTPSGEHREEMKDLAWRLECGLRGELHMP